MKIFYGLPGEGLGHCTRTLSVLDFCPKDWEIHIFTWGEAYDYLKSQNYPHLHQIASIPFGRVNGKIDTLATAKSALKFLINFIPSYKDVLKLAREHKPDIFISDCEGIIPRVARKVKTPCISVDNQHKFSRCFSNDLPFDLRIYSIIMGIGTELLVPNPVCAVVSTFYHATLRKLNNKTILTNCFMRKALEEIKPTQGDFILVYYKSSCGPKILEMLSKTNEKVKVYGCPTKPYPQFEYYSIGNNFIKDLASCKALFCSAGNQLLGEALFYSKNVFAVPEPKQPEQYINAYCLKQMGDESCYVEYLNEQIVKSFLNNIKEKKGVGINGARMVVGVIEKVVRESNEVKKKDTLFVRFRHALRMQIHKVRRVAKVFKKR